MAQQTPPSHPQGCCSPSCPMKHSAPASAIAPSGTCPMRAFHPAGSHSHCASFDDARNRLMRDKNVRPVRNRIEFFDDPIPLPLAYWTPPLWSGFAGTPVDDMMFETALTAADMMQDVAWRPRVDVDFDDKKKEMIVLAELPGMQKEDVTIEVDKGALVIKGEKTAGDVIKEEEGKTKNILTERFSGYFCRRFQLPSNYKPDGINATMENGVLRVTVKVDDSDQGKQQITVK
ncbi:bradyzoite antigen BAG1 [Besnoitia besnoiti]|uniref:Bradyzoite antigen BAG1 n=1 Tax=Besnoitia besnoiti TaxID=94643 RepID=A0A2A9MPE6_BESBE|nr:bradyzoite antigen BAG1 [Besnoitia besnoiti]PFH37923.1 bradyzoite antigen BAG1 [Besnoitia besnoiti]